jgi:predicted RNase H-related nuclease YkuK (DUF458 family)
MDKFKFYNGDYVGDTIDYVKSYINEHTDVKIIVGTDSEQYPKYTNYVTVICLIRPTKGVHVIYREDRVKKNIHLVSKLWKEVEYSRYVADELEKGLNEGSDKKIVSIHIDINDKKTAASNVIHDSAVGYLKGLGYDVESKPNSWVASKAADWLC